MYARLFRVWYRRNLERKGFNLPWMLLLGQSYLFVLWLCENENVGVTDM